MKAEGEEEKKADNAPAQCFSNMQSQNDNRALMLTLGKK